MTEDPAALETVRNLLETISMGQVEFHEMLAERILDHSSDAADEDEAITLSLRIEYMESEAEARCGVRVSVEVVDEDVHVRVLAGAQWTLPSQDALAEDAVRDVFVTRVAVPALYPYIRVKVQELSAATGGKVVVLGIVDPRRFMEATSIHGDSAELKDSPT